MSKKKGFLEMFGIPKKIPAQKPDASVLAGLSSFFSASALKNPFQHHSDSQRGVGGCVVKNVVILPSGHRIEVVLGDLTLETVHSAS
jgi:hypothetical protein